MMCLKSVAGTVRARQTREHDRVPADGIGQNNDRRPTYPRLCGPSQQVSLYYLPNYCIYAIKLLHRSSVSGRWRKMDAVLFFWCPPSFWPSSRPPTSAGTPVWKWANITESSASTCGRATGSDISNRPTFTIKKPNATQQTI